MGKRIKKPKIVKTPSKKSVRSKLDPQRYDRDKIAWGASIIDFDGPWCPRKINTELTWSDIFIKLQHLESMTWSEILVASGGRKSGNNSHSIPINNLSREARNRLAEISQDDIDELFSLRLTGTQRVFGIRDGRVLKLLWFDLNHEVCPTST